MVSRYGTLERVWDLPLDPLQNGCHFCGHSWKSILTTNISCVPGHNTNHLIHTIYQFHDSTPWVSWTCGSNILSQSFDANHLLSDRVFEYILTFSMLHDKYILHLKTLGHTSWESQTCKTPSRYKCWCFFIFIYLTVWETGRSYVSKLREANSFYLYQSVRKLQAYYFYISIKSIFLLSNRLALITQASKL